MKHSTFSPEDPKFTAYALGQLEGDERAEVEAVLRHDPDARAFVEQTKAFSTQLETALVDEPIQAPGKPLTTVLTPPAARAAIINGRDPSKLDGGGLPEYRAGGSKILQFPQLYFVIGGLAAACFAVLIALRQEKPSAPMRYYREVRLRPEGASQPPAAAAPAVASAESAKLGEENPVPPKPDTAERVAQMRGSIFGSNDEKGGLLAQVKPDLSGINRINTGTGATRAAATAPTGTGSLHLAATEAGAQNGVVVMAPYKVEASAQNSYGAATLAAAPSAPRRVDVGMVSLGSRDVRFQWSAEQAMPLPSARTAFNTESYAYHPDNGFVTPQQSAFSTFSVDVDTASYSNVRRFVDNGRLPPPDAVRIEELLNYFPYRYDAPPVPVGDKRLAPFAASLEVAEAPWAPAHRLVRIGLKARELATTQRPPANLVFLLDVSGSMRAPNKLPLVKKSMQVLVEALRPDDRVAIVTYAGTSGMALPSTPVAKIRDIEEALDGLVAGGSTNGAMGIQLAYDIAKANFVAGGINRVILCTDGDFNVGTTSHGELARLIEEKAKTGVALTALGFGMGNVKDSTLELLADKGNGNYGYVDSRKEAEKLLAQQVNATLMTVAKDVKVQVDFNPAHVASYRLIGYENRLLRSQDFNNDTVDAGEIGAGHSVTALYEIVPVGSKEPAAAPAPPVDKSKYQPENLLSELRAAKSADLLTVKIRYKEPDAEVSQKLEFPLVDNGVKFANASSDFQFAAAVASYGMILRNSAYRGNATMGDVISWAAAGAAKDDPGGYRGDFVDLARRTQALMR